MIKGFATPEGTAAYKARFPQLHGGHFRKAQGLWFSSIGIGSYLGEPDEATDRLYEEALQEAVTSGVNAMDAAINYRCQRSERAFGRALKTLIESGKVKREEIIVSTKGGFIPFDGTYPADPHAYFKKTYLETGLLKPEDMAQGCHAMTPKFLEDQLSKSLANLGLETLDIYYIHNPETQLEDVERAPFLERLRLAFRWAEEKVKEGRIRMYGTATWQGYRVEPEAGEYLSLEEIHVIAREAGGSAHHFRAVQLPVNLAMPEAWVFPNQSYGANLVPFLTMARQYGLAVAGSGSLLQARLAKTFPAALERHFASLSKPAQKALQFARSVPGMTTSLVGMKTKEHVRENLETAKVAPLTEEELLLMFQQAD